MCARILIIEDNADNLDLMNYLLTAFGHTTLTAHDGAEGLRRAQTEAPELILCDIHLPVMTGYEVGRVLKGDPATAGIPLVAVTASAMIGDRDRLLAAGFDGYIAKPIDPEKFVGQIEAFLPRRELPAAASGGPQRTILVVDDRPANRELLVTLLGYRGHRLLEASDGAEALARAREGRPDLVITDILMPTMDGYEFVHQLRQDAALAAVPVIFWTAHYHTAQARALAQSCGVRHLLTKPSEPDVILRTVDEVLGLGPPPPPPSPAEFDREHLRVLTDKLAEQSHALRAANDRLTAMIDINLHLASERDPKRLLQVFCHAARNLFGARFAVVALRDLAGQAPPLLFTSGLSAEAGAAMRPTFPCGGVLARLLTERRTARSRASEADPAVLGLPQGHPPFRSWLGAPIVSLTKEYGWLSLADKVGLDEFTEQDERLAGILAAQVGRIYENGHLYAEARGYAAELELEVGERRRAEEELDRFINLSPSLLAIVGLDGRYRRVNPAWEKILGFTHQELLATPLLDLVHPDDRAATRRELERLTRGEPTDGFECRCRRKDGSYRWILWTATPILDQGLFYETGHDITERKQTEETLRLHDQALAALSDGVLITDSRRPDDPIIYANPAFERLTGYSRDEVLGRNCRFLQGKDSDPVAVAAMRKALAAGEPCAVELINYRKDGTPFWNQVTLAPLRDAAGKVTHFVGIQHDLTRRRQLEAQFLQAQKMEAIGRLAGGVAHDFNNLLTVIIGYSDMLLAGLAENDSSRELIAQVQQAGHRAAALTRQLLLFSRRQMSVPEVLDLNQVLTNMQKLIGRLIGEDIEMRLHLRSDLWPVRADPAQLEQVVMNLVVNARDAMPTGGELEITTRNQVVAEPDPALSAVPPGEYVTLEVRDTGSGMDATTLTRIFEPFFTTKPPEKGTGLGLATVYGVIKHAGGHIDVRSEVGRGSTFTIFLPRAEKTSSRPGFAPTPSAAAGGSEVVLLVEDDEGVRALSTHVLHKQGYTVLAARTGAEAIRLSDQYAGEIHLVVTDVVMPQMSGVQVVAHLTASRPGLKVLYLSGYTDEALVPHGAITPETPFLHKPFSPEILARKVREVLAGPGV